MLIPILWISLAVGGLVAAAALIPRGKKERVVVLDKTLPDADAQLVLQAIIYNHDPAALTTMAAHYAGLGYACTAFELTLRAWELSKKKGPKPVRPASCAGSSATPSTATPAAGPPGMSPQDVASACASIDPTMDAVTCTAVLNALETSTSVNDLTSFAESIRTAHPRAAALLVIKANALASGQPNPFAAIPGAPSPGGPPAPAAAPGASPAGSPTQSGPSAACPGLDASLSPDQCTEVTAALASNYDAQMLQIIALKYPAAQYPLASAALGTKIALLQLGGPAPAPAPTGGAEITQGTQAGAAGPPMIVDGPAPAGMAPFLQGELNPPTIDPAIAEVAALTPQIGQISAMPAAYAPLRPRGHWFVEIRPQDRVWPASLAKMGSGAQSGALPQLYAMNPHLQVGATGVVESFKVGDLVNIPGTWTDALIKRGFKVAKD